MTIRRRLALALLTVAPIAALLAQAPASAPAGPSSDPVAQNLNLRFANGIVAVAEEKIITVADVMQEIGPLIPQLRNSARNEKEFQEGLERLQDDAIQNLIDRVLIVKEFRKDEKRQIPQQYIENAISEELAERFEGDRSKFLAFLRSKGQTIRDYRREVE
ncbi:MAG: SurA N-terminal domain-containing protein, partial [Opitutaceae bacterium]